MIIQLTANDQKRAIDETMELIIKYNDKLSLSFAITSLRQTMPGARNYGVKHGGINFPTHMGDAEDTFKHLGFKIRRSGKNDRFTFITI